MSFAILAPLDALPQRAFVLEVHPNRIGMFRNASPRRLVPALNFRLAWWWWRGWFRAAVIQCRRNVSTTQAKALGYPRPDVALLAESADCF